MANEPDTLAPVRDSVAQAITVLRAFTAPAGSAEMRQAQSALDYLGYAYSILSAERFENPAWSDD